MTSNLLALSPLDGRYHQQLDELRPFFSEYGLIHYRLLIEIEWFKKLSEVTDIKEIPPFDPTTINDLEQIHKAFNTKDAEAIKKTEVTTNHDVKALEYFLKDKIKDHPLLA